MIPGMPSQQPGTPMNQGVTPMADGGLEVELADTDYMEEMEPDAFQEGGHYENLIYYFEEDRDLDELALEVIDNLEADEESKEEWKFALAEGVKSLGLDPDMAVTNLGKHSDGMCTATHPLLLESAVKFQSKFTAEMLPAKGPVRTQVIGKSSDEKTEQATRVQTHMNYQVTHEMPEYADEMDKLGFHLPLYGSAFKKMYWDQTMDRPVAEFVHVDQFVVAENAKSLETAERYTHIIEKTPNQLQKDINALVYLEPKGFFSSEGGTGLGLQQVIDAENTVIGDDPTHSVPSNRIHTLYEQHVYMALPAGIDGGLIRPYVLTVDLESQSLLSVRRNWSESDPKAQMSQWFSHYKYVPGFGFHGLGLIHLLGDMQKTLTVVLRSLVDAGQYANLQGGFKAKGVKMDTPDEPIGMGEFREVNTQNQDIQKSLMPLPFKEPSATLYQLLEYLTGASQKFADSTEQVIQDSSNYGPVGTTMALLEASVKFFSAIHKRCHRSQGKELKILARLNFEFLDEKYPFDVPGGVREVLRRDYDPRTVDVIPASDPNITSQAHRISLAQSKLQAALQAPEIHNKREVYKDFYLALGVDDIDEFLLPPPVATPLGPMEDVLAAQQGQPIKAFPGQAHEAHVGFKMAWMQDPTQGGSGMFPQIMPALQANIQEHQIMSFQEKVQAQLQAQGQQGQQGQQTVQVTGAATDPKTQEMLLAQAAQQVAQTNQMMAQEKAEGGPAGMIAKAELMEAETDRMKEQREMLEGDREFRLKLLALLNDMERDQTKAGEAQRKLDLDEEKLAADLLKESAKLASGEKSIFVREAGQDRRESKKELSADIRDRRKAATEMKKAAAQARKVGRDGTK